MCDTTPSHEETYLDAVSTHLDWDDIDAQTTDLDALASAEVAEPWMAEMSCCTTPGNCFDADCKFLSDQCFQWQAQAHLSAEDHARSESQVASVDLFANMSPPLDFAISATTNSSSVQGIDEAWDERATADQLDTVPWQSTSADPSISHATFSACTSEQAENDALNNAGRLGTIDPLRDNRTVHGLLPFQVTAREPIQSKVPADAPLEVSMSRASHIACTYCRMTKSNCKQSFPCSRCQEKNLDSAVQVASGYPEQVVSIDRKRKRRARLPAASREILRKWLREHQADPYPSRGEKDQLILQTGLTDQQVSTWFVNNRQRQPNPMERFMSTSSEDEAASLQDIERNLVHFEHEQNGRVSPALPDFRSSFPRSNSASSVGSAFSQCNDAVLQGPPRKGRKRFVSGNRSPSGSAYPAAVSSDCDSGYRGSDRASEGDHHRSGSSPSPYAQYPARPLTSSEHRRKSTVTKEDQPSSGSLRRKPNEAEEEEYRAEPPPSPVKLPDPIMGPMVDAETYQCTFCLRSLSAKAWKRHEETQHLPRKQWICMPSESPSIQRPGGTEPSCAFCGAASTAAEDCHHRVPDCLVRPLQDRTYTRKDHLRQHAKDFHGARLDEDVLSLWCSERTYQQYTWLCGFCGEHLRNWDERATHISKHFRAGNNMRNWIYTQTALERGDIICEPTQNPQVFVPASHGDSGLLSAYRCTHYRCVLDATAYVSRAEWREHEHTHAVPQAWICCTESSDGNNSNGHSSSRECGYPCESVALGTLHSTSVHSSTPEKAQFQADVTKDPTAPTGRWREALYLKFWCGFCVKTVEIQGALGEAFAVVEKRLNHFEEHHFTTLNCTPWVKFGSRLGAGQYDQIVSQVASVGLTSLDDDLA